MRTDMIDRNYTKDTLHGFVQKAFAVFIAFSSLFLSTVVFAAPASCPNAFTSYTPAASCAAYCRTQGYASGGGDSTCGGVYACLCYGTPASGSGGGGSRAATPGAATPVTSGRFSYDVKFDNPLGGACSHNQAIKCSRDSDCGAGNQCQNVNIPVIAGNVIRYVLGIIGSVALIIFLYGGIQWMIATGDDTRVKKGLDTMIWAGLGLVIIFGSYVAVQFLLTAVLGS